VNVIVAFIFSHVADVVALVGGALVVVGLGMIYPPLAWIMAGLLLIASAVIGARR
jgi:hypothetical protein